MIVSKSSFSNDQDLENGWHSESKDGNYKNWVAYKGPSHAVYNWSCNINGEKALIKVWQEYESKEALIDKYGWKQDRCGGIEKFSLHLGETLIIPELVIQSNGCADATPVLRSIYFGDKVSPNIAKDSIRISISLSDNGSERFFYASVNTKDKTFKLRKNIASLPIQTQLIYKQ